MNSEEKAKKYMEENRVFPLMNSETYEIWVVDGITGNWIVRYDKLKDIYSCNCKNIRLSPCCHILAVSKTRDEK